MPIYSYACPACEHRFDELVPMAEREHQPCPNCGGTANQKVTPVRFDVLGMGWDRDFATFSDQWDRLRDDQKRKEDKVYANHGDYGPRPGAD